MLRIAKTTACLISIVTCGVLGAAPAEAADLPVKAPISRAVAAPVFSWTGCYVGVNGGGAWVKRSNSLSITNDPLNPAFNPQLIPSVAANGTGSLNSSGPTGGAQAGCNYQSGTFVWGGEADFDWMNQRQSFGGRFFYPPVGGIPSAYQLNTTEKVSWLSTFRARLGAVVADRVLLYATGGLAVAEFSSSQSFFDEFGAVGGAGSISKVKVGWAAGAGAEFAISMDWSLRAEYLFAQFGGDSNNWVLGNANFGLAPYQNSLGNLTVQTARLAVNYRFH